MYFVYRLLNRGGRRARVGLTTVVMACVSLAASAADSPYNSSHLSATQAPNLEQICETVMGLRPAEALTDNRWPGNPDPRSSTNEYRGCIASLSASLESVAAARAVRQADQNCRAGGLQPGSSDLALCTLRAIEGTPDSGRIQLASREAGPFIGARSRESTSSVPTSVRRQQLACAEIGLEPDESAFADCVEGLTRVLSAEFMEEAYRN